MTEINSARFSDGLVVGIPIALGYFPIAFAFGVAATSQGLSGWEAFGLSLIIYAGAAQFLALSLITGGASLIVAALTLIAMNLRHVLYGPALMKAAGNDRRKRAWIWAFGLTDEVFGAALGALARGKVFSEPFMFGLGIMAYGAWLSGTALGAWAGGGALAGFPAVEAGLSFMLPALFLALLLSILSRVAMPAIAVAVLLCVVVSLTIDPTAGVLAGMIGGAMAGVLGRRNAE